MQTNNNFNKGEAFGERLKDLRNAKGLSQKDLAARIGVSTTTIQNYERGQLPNGEYAILLAEVLDCPIEWLLTGKRSQVVSFDRATRSSYFEPSRRFDLPAIPNNIDENGGRLNVRNNDLFPMEDGGNFDLVPMAETHISAGEGTDMLSERREELYAFRKEWIRSITSNKADLVLIRVRGTSMEPTIRDKDVVMIDTEQKYIYERYIYAIGQGNMITIRRLEFTPSGRIRMVSDNRAEFEPFEVKTEELRIIGQVVWFAREMGRG